MKLTKLLIVGLIFLQIFGFIEPAFAIIPEGAFPLEWRPRYKNQIEYIMNNSCEAKGMVPYNGDVYYICPSGERFWSKVLSPIDSSVVLFKNPKSLDDEDES